MSVNKQLEQRIYEILDKNSSIVTDALGQQVIKELLALIQSEKVKATQDCELSIMKDLYSLNQTQWQAKYGYMFEPPDRTGNK